MKQQNKWEKLFDEYLDFVEFELVKNPNGYFNLRDCTGANLGNIEEEEFDNVGWLFDRMDRYIYDYFVSSIEECIEEAGYDTYVGDYQGLIKYCKDKIPDSQWDLDILDMICNHYEEINLENCYYMED